MKEGIKRVGKLLLFVMILPLAFTLVVALSIIAFFYMLVETVINKDKRNIGNIIDGLSHYFKTIDLAIDQMGNVAFANILNKHFLDLTNPNIHLFGDPDETISEVTGINFLLGTLKRKWLQQSLNFVEKNHSKNAFISSYEKSVSKINKYKNIYDSLK